METDNLFQTGFRHIKTLNAHDAIPDRYLHESPRIPVSIREILDEYIVRHFFVTCPFKALPEQKSEYAYNSECCKELKRIIINSGYIGTFAVIRYGYVLTISVNYPIDEDTGKREVKLNGDPLPPEINTAWLRTL